MTELLAFEWRRMRSLRGTWVLLALAVGFALLADLAVGLGRFREPLDAEDLAVHVVQRDLMVRWLVAAAIGAQAFGHDFRYGTIRPTLLAFPRRGQVLAGKVMATSLLSAAAAVAASAASIVLLPVLTGWDGGVFADPRLWRSIALGIVSAGLVAALAVGLAALARGSGLPVVMIVLWAHHGHDRARQVRRDHAVGARQWPRRRAASGRAEVHPGRGGRDFPRLAFARRRRLLAGPGSPRRRGAVV